MIFTLTGPSCTGKSTLEAMLRSAGFQSLTSVTTRPMRAGEVNGEAYHFITPEAFASNRDAGAYVEHVEFNGNQYAVSKAEVQRALATGKPIVVVVEPVGLKQIRAYAEDMGWSVYSIFIDGPLETIAQRLLKRFAKEHSVHDIDKQHRAIGSYASRLSAMMGVERQWVQAAVRDKGEMYEYFMRSFDESTMDGEVEKILTLADLAQKESA